MLLQFLYIDILRHVHLEMCTNIDKYLFLHIALYS